LYVGSFLVYVDFFVSPLFGAALILSLFRLLFLLLVSSYLCWGGPPPPDPPHPPPIQILLLSCTDDALFFPIYEMNLRRHPYDLVALLRILLNFPLSRTRVCGLGRACF